MHIDHDKLKKFLLDSRLIPKEKITEVEKRALKDSTAFSEAVVSLGMLSQGDIKRAEAYVTGVPFVNLKEQHIDYDVLSIVPEPIARRHNIISFRKTADSLEVAMLDIDDLGAIDFIRKKTGLTTLPRLADEHQQ